MLPNFRKNDVEKLSSSASDLSAAYPAKPMLAVPPRGEPRTVSVIGADLTIVGNLISKGEVHVDGNVEGDIEGSYVIVGESASISGGIVAEEVIVRGHVAGTVKSKRVMLQATSQVEGDIYHQALSIEQGAMFEGKSRRVKDDPRTIETVRPISQSAPAVDLVPAFMLPPKLPLPN